MSPDTLVHAGTTRKIEQPALSQLKASQPSEGEPWNTIGGLELREAGKSETWPFLIASPHSNDPNHSLPTPRYA